MSSVLIADSGKSSLVMTSEIFKDTVQGITVYVAGSGAEAIDKVQLHKPDMCLVDFDLPDTDGVTLVELIRKVYDGPILMTAFVDEIVKQAAKNHLFTFEDAGAWIEKPVNESKLVPKIEKFFINKHRIVKRFNSELDTELIGKNLSKNKKLPQVNGKILNVSMGGVCLQLDQNIKIKKSEELILALPLSLASPEKHQNKESTLQTKNKKGAKNVKGKKKVQKKLATKKPSSVPTTKIKVKMTWQDSKSKTVGLQFSKLTELQKNALGGLLKQLDQ